MKKQVLLAGLMLLSLMASAQVKRTINVETAGTLLTLISEEEKYTIEELTLTGELNGTDFRLLRDMAGKNYKGESTDGKLRVLDLSGVKIVAGGVSYYERSNSQYSLDNSDEIPDFAFMQCNLQVISLPESLKGIGEYAFSENNKLTSIILPDGLVKINRCAFLGNRSLTSIIIPNSVNSIGKEVLASCSGLTSINVQPGNQYYDSRESCNAIIEKSTNTLISGCVNSFIPESVRRIEDRAFYFITSLESIFIPYSVTSIGREAFNGCELSSIIVDSRNSTYDSRTNCNAIIETATNTLVLGCVNTFISSTVSAIGPNAFSGRQNLSSIKIPGSIQTIGNSAFSNCIHLRTVELSEGVKEIGEGAFGSCWGLSRVILPSSLTKIGKYAFSGRISGREWNQSFYVNIANPLPIEEGTFGNRKNAKLFVPSGSENLYAAADYWKEFRSIESMDFNIEFADSKVKEVCVTNWDSNGDGELSKIEASIVTSLGVTFKENREIESFDELQYFTGITSIQSQVFYGCQNLKSVIIPENVNSIQDLLFYGWHPQTLSVVENNPYFMVEDGVLYNKEKTTLVYYMNKDDRQTFDIPSSVSYIRSFAFAGNKLTSLDIPEGVKYIGSEVFASQTLASVTFPKSAISIGTYLFEYCHNLTTIKVLEGNPVYDSRDNCNGIILTEKNALVQGCSTTVIPKTVTSIADYAFWCIHSEFSLVIPDNVVSIGNMAFTGSNITSVIIPSSIESIGKAAFSCYSLKSVTVMHQEPMAIDEEAFANRANATLYVPSGCKAAYEAAEYWKDFKEIIEMGETAPITIGKSGKASYCGDKSLDFSFSEEVKAYIATGFDKDEGTIWLTRVKDVPAGVPVLIKGDANKTYDVPVTDSQNSYYTNMFVGNTTGETIKVGETEGDLVNYYLSSDGTFKSVNKSVNIGNNKSYLQLPGTFNPAEVGATQTVTIKSSGKASFAAPVDLDFTNVAGLKAFTATGYDKSSKTIWLTRVMKVQKGEGVLLKGDAKDYEIPSAAVQSSYMNMFVGNISGEKIQVQETSADGSQTNFYLNGDGAFVSVNGFVNIGNNKCYLELPTSMVAVASTRGAEVNYILEEPEIIKMPVFRSIGNDGDGTTGIKDQSSKFNVPSDAYYTLQGQRVVNPGKGLYIKNGKKIVIK